jgi:hypothetical protein
VRPASGRPLTRTADIENIAGYFNDLSNASYL